MHRPTVTLQTPAGRGGIAVLALAGAGSEAVISRVFRPRKGHAAGGDGVLQLGHLVDGPAIIDEAIVCRAAGGYEINIHGGPVVARAAMELLVRCGAVACPAAASARESFPLAHPRWNNPAIGWELLEALPLAQSELALAAITRQWSDGLSRLASEILERLNSSSPAAEDAASLRRCAAGATEIHRLLVPAEVVLAGPPNAGKSTLANALVGRAVSIVDPAAGTTRDWVRELAILSGVPVYLTDTAGLWEASGEVGAEAVARARRRAGQADLVLLLSADGRHDVPEWLVKKKTVLVASKCDLNSPCNSGVLAVSAHTGQGMDALKAAVIEAMGLAGIDWSAPRAFTDRQVKLLEAAATAIDDADAGAPREHLKRLLDRD